MTIAAPTAGSAGAFAPLRHRVFAVLWVATVAGNVGSFMRDVASAWLVTGLTDSPAAVALVQAAATLPLFLLTIPAGVLADIVDRRRLLLAVQLLLAATSAALTLLAAQGALTLPLLLGLVLLGGVGAALMGPAWQSVVPELVPRTELRSAVALNALGINIARAVGPALGGLVLGTLGAAATYGADVLSYLLVIAALLWWPRGAPAADPLPEHFVGAMRAGLRYVRASAELHRVLLRAVLFFTFASAVWALLPLVARQLLGRDAGGYGVMLACIGVGAVTGATLLPRLRLRWGTETLLLAAAGVASGVMAALVLLPVWALALPLLLLLGAAWITALTTLGGVAQAIVPNWVRGRGMAVYITVFNGAMTVGSVAWGALAQAIGLVPALVVAAIGLLLAALLARQLPLPAGEADLQPVAVWPQPPALQPQGDAGHAAHADHAAATRGPVIVQVEYRSAPSDRPALVLALRALAVVCRRDGASAWGLAEDVEQPELLIEWFVVDSWAEHLRQHQRSVVGDAALREAVQRAHQGPEPPRVRHLLGLA